MNRNQAIESAKLILEMAGVKPEEYLKAMGGKVAPEDDELINAIQGQKLLSISKRKFMELVKEGKLTRIIISDRNIKYSKRAVLKFIRSCKEAKR